MNALPAMPSALRRFPSIVRTRPTPCNHKRRDVTRRWEETVGADIILEGFVFTGIGTMVACISELTPHNLSVSNSLLTVLGIVLGLVVGFRTSSAYERYQEGRKLWADIAVASGNLGQLIWSHVPDVDVLVDLTSHGNLDTKKVKIDKREVLTLIQAFSISVKQFICCDQRDNYESELKNLVSWLPGLPSNSGRTKRRFESPGVEPPPLTPGLSLPSSKLESSEDLEAAVPKFSNPGKAEKNSSRYTFPHFTWWTQRNKEEGRPRGKIKYHECERCPPRPILPLQISQSLHHYVNLLRINALIPDPLLSLLITNLDSLQQAVVNLERIRTTPIPFAYQIHLKFSLWLYLAFLPFQVVDQMKWATIPGTFFASLLLLGFHAIGQQIENPFNGDANDLDMDDFCHCIKIELEEIAGNPAPAAFIGQMFKRTAQKTTSSWNDTGNLTLVKAERSRKTMFPGVPQFESHGDILA